MGWQDAPIVTAQGGQPAWASAPVVNQDTPSGNSSGLTERSIFEGLGDVAQLPANLVRLVDRVGASGRNYLRGLLGLHQDAAPLPVSQAAGPNPGDLASNGLGLGTAQTGAQQLYSSAVRGATGAFAGGIGALDATVPNAVRLTTAGASSGLMSDAARQAGLPPWAQFAAGTVGGLVPAGVEAGARYAGRAFMPLTRGGQQQIAANILRRSATDPDQAATNLENTEQIVPGSQRTSGEASQDLGLLRLEKGLRSAQSESFAQRMSDQNTAQQAELTSMGGRPQDVAELETQRDAATGPMREAALSNPVGRTIGAPVNVVQDTIDGILGSPAGARGSVKQVMGWLRGEIGNETDPARLYEIRKDVNDAILGKYTPSSDKAPNASTMALVRGQLGDVRDSLDNAIEAAAPGFKAYLERYRELSRPIDQMQAIQQIQSRAALQVPDVRTRLDFLGNGKFSTALDQALADKRVQFTPEQTQRLEAIRTDLELGQAVNSRAVRAPGSDTFQNLSIAQVLGSGVNSIHPTLRILQRPLSWLYRLGGTDQSVNQMLVDAMLDPKLGAMMLRRATPKSVQTFSEALRVYGLPYIAGTALGTRTTSSPQPAPQTTPQIPLQ